MVIAIRSIRRFTVIVLTNEKCTELKPWNWQCKRRHNLPTGAQRMAVKLWRRYTPYLITLLPAWFQGFAQNVEDTHQDLEPKNYAVHGECHCLDTTDPQLVYEGGFPQQSSVLPGH